MSAPDERADPVLSARQLIPGAYDRGTLTHRQPGAMGGPAFGSAAVGPLGPSSMDEATTRERRREGGRLRRLP
jgi:hypothetical protein